VNKIVWNKNKVEVTTVGNTQFSAAKIILTVPIGILQNEAAITFVPAINDKIEAAKNIGYGSVVKVLIEFEQAFWKDIQLNASFIFSEEKIPVWWTQFPANNHLLTGWLGGPNATAMQEYPPEQLLDIVLQSLDAMFDTKLPPITAWHIANWQKEPFSLGAYSYDTLQSKNAKARLKTPVENTIYFAGEAIYTGEAPGTVEAALVSGRDAAGLLLQNR